MKYFILFFSLLPLMFTPLHAQSEEEQLPISTLLEQLDDAIVHKKEFQAQRSAKADSLREIASHQSGRECLATLNQLFDLYMHFETDEALTVLGWERRLPVYSEDEQVQQQVTINEAQVYGMMGLYNKAFKMLQGINHANLSDEARLRYYNAMHAILDWRADYALRTVPSLASEMLEEAAVYHDSLLMVEPDEDNRTIIRTNRDYDYGDYQECIDTLLALMPHCNSGVRTFAYSRLSQAYGKLGENALQLRYLILTAIADVRAGNTEYMALPELAHHLFLAGDNDRAYEYLFCALEDANICKSNLRTIEVSTIFPIIDQSRHAKMDHERKDSIMIIIGLSLIALLLAGGLIVLYRLNLKLHNTRQLLAKANNDLKQSNIQLMSVNKDLVLSDKVKEEYLMNYLTRSRTYLASIESMQHQILKQVQARQFDDLVKRLKSSEFVDEEQEKFYADFDEAFLTLHPNFVEKFNALLKPEAAILPKKGELLTTELRIFGLIRMGETDSTKIAKFLNYSLTTIYNYRSRVRNNALGDKDNFEAEVMKL